jgi:hypothetical protein
MMQKHFIQINKQQQLQTKYINNSRENNENHIKIPRLL